MKQFKNSICKKSLLLTLLFPAVLAFSACSGNSTDSGGETNNVNFDATLAAGQSYSYTFDSEGAYEYFCQIHAPNMQGVVNVSTDANTQDTVTVMISNMSFVPFSTTIAPGATVKWVNEDDMNHTVTSGNPNSDDDNDDDPGGPNY